MNCLYCQANLDTPEATNALHRPCDYHDTADNGKVVFTEYNCPACRAHFFRQPDGQIKQHGFYYKDFLLSFDHIKNRFTISKEFDIILRVENCVPEITPETAPKRVPIFLLFL